MTFRDILGNVTTVNLLLKPESWNHPGHFLLLNSHHPNHQQVLLHILPSILNNYTSPHLYYFQPNPVKHDLFLT